MAYPPAAPTAPPPAADQAQTAQQPAALAALTTPMRCNDAKPENP